MTELIIKYGSKSCMLLVITTDLVKAGKCMNNQKFVEGNYFCFWFDFSSVPLTSTHDFVKWNTLLAAKTNC